MFKLMKLEPEIKTDQDAAQVKLTAQNANVTFENVCFEYVEGKKILDGLSFTVPAGKRVILTLDFNHCSFTFF